MSSALSNRSSPRAVALALALWFLPAPAQACPNCASGAQARSQVYGDDVGFNLAVVLLPFFVIGVLCWWAEGMGKVPASAAATDGLAKEGG